MANGHDSGKQVRAERARAVGLFRYSLIREAADPAAVDQAAGPAGPGSAAREHAGPFGQPVRVSRATIDRWIRDWRRGGFDALVPDPRQVAPRTPAEVLELAAALKTEVPGTDRGAGRDDPAGPCRLGAGRADPAAPLRAPGAEHPAGRAATEGVRPVRGRRAERAVDRRRVARPDRGRPQGDPVRVPRRPQPAVDRVPVGPPGGHGAAGGRAAHRPRRPRYPRLDLCRQRLGVRGQAAAAGLRVVGDPARPLQAGPARRPGQDRTVVPHRAGPVPRRDRLRPRTRRPGPAEHAVHRLGGDRLPPPHPLRDRPDPDRTVVGRSPRRCRRRRSCGRRSCGRSGAPSPRPRPSACTATTTKSTPPLVGRKVELVFDPFDLTAIEVRWQGRSMGHAVPHRIGTARPPQGPTRRHHRTPGGTDRDRLPPPGRSPAHRRTGRPAPLLPAARPTSRRPTSRPTSREPAARRAPRRATAPARHQRRDRRRTRSARSARCRHDREAPVPLRLHPDPVRARAWRRRCCTATAPTPKPSPGSAGASANAASA